MAYLLDMTKAHRQSFIELVNHDNAATIGSALTLADVTLSGERTVDQAGEGIAAEYGITIALAAYPSDTVEVYWNKIQLEDVMAMDVDMTSDTGGEYFDWYTPDEWDDATSPALALAAFATACTAQNIDSAAAMEDLAVSRSFNSTTNRYYLDFTMTSMVFEPTASYQLPRYFAEEITVTALNGFVFTPIAAEDVVF